MALCTRFPPAPSEGEHEHGTHSIPSGAYGARNEKLSANIDYLFGRVKGVV